MKKLISFAASLVLLFTASTASAVQINGTINFTGGATYTANAAGDGLISMNFSTVTVNFDSFLLAGDFAGLENTTAVFSDINVADAFPATFWSVGDFTFSITSIETNTLNEIFSNFNYAMLSGAGIISAAGFEDTAAAWVITGNGLAEGISMSATSIALPVSVPAPAGAALLGLSLLGLGFARRNKIA